MPQNLPPMQFMSLPSNATSIRTDINDSFRCDGRDYGYYADVENDCQLFHVCLPVTYSDGRNHTFRWSFICPEETVFNQVSTTGRKQRMLRFSFYSRQRSSKKEMFTCTRADESIDCAESPRYYGLNRNFGVEDEVSVTEASNDLIEEDTAGPADIPQGIGRIYTRRGRRIPHKQQ
ncbi:hypothetical protein NQ318_005382 [Aromia moschata]|uniref:Chitin-binding type-2 domain-containing protein n=1 Tax=Aromia moschata TaxID=1265417 RepID=A0AAV8YWC7_9CUCU|nr:hypothetical protein NQ318_005382 [Aromia moschata]